MKKIITLSILSLLMTTAQANFFGSNDGEWKMGPNGPYWDESNWPEWTPMYWMEEFMDSWDDDDDNYYGGGYGMPGGGYGFQGMPYNGGYPMTPYGGGGGYYPYPAMPYGYAPQIPAVPTPTQ